MKNILTIIATLLVGLATTVYAANITFPVNGGTGTATKPTLGQVLVGNASGIYAPQSTSSLNIVTTALSGWALSTSTVACPDGMTAGLGCSFTGPNAIQAAYTAGYNTVYLKNGIYTNTAPILVPRAGFTLLGEGNSSEIRYSGTLVKIGLMNNTGTELGNTLFRDFKIRETGAGGQSTCFDGSRLVNSKVEHIQCDSQKIGFIASTSQSYYNTYDTDDVIHISGGVGTLTSVAFYFGDNGSGDGGPIDNVILNSHVFYTGTGSSTGYYINSHSIKCINCNSEGGYIGMSIGSFASDGEFDVYLEANKINFTSVASQAEVGGVHLTGNISDARTNAENVVDNGITAFCVDARIQYAGANYCTNVKQGFGTNNPNAILHVSDDNEAQTPGLHNDSLGLFGARGPAIELSHGNGERYLVNGSLSNTLGWLDFVLATSSASDGEPIGVRFDVGNQIGTGDVLIQPEVQSTGYGIFEPYSSSTISGSTAGTYISSRASDIILGPNRNSNVFRITYPNQRVGLATTSPWGLLSLNGRNGNNEPIFVIATSTSGFATTTAIRVDTNGNMYFTNGNGLRIGSNLTNLPNGIAVSGTASSSKLFASALTAFTVGDSAVCQNPSGEITVDVGVSSCIVSTRLVKHDIVNTLLGGAATRLTGLNPVTFTYNGSNKKDIGLIAEDTAKVDPRYAQYKNGKPVAINWSAITSDLVKVVQDIIARLDGHDKKLKDMQTQLDEQQKEIDALKAKIK